MVVRPCELIQFGYQSHPFHLDGFTFFVTCGYFERGIFSEVFQYSGGRKTTERNSSDPHGALFHPSSVWTEDFICNRVKTTNNSRRRKKIHQGLKGVWRCRRAPEF